MNIKFVAGNLLLMTLMLGAPQAALAGPPDPGPDPTCDLTDVPFHEIAHGCRVELLNLFDEIMSAESVNDRDESKLLAKVCAADDKLHIATSDKTGDAIAKLQNIIDTVNNKKKI